MITFDYNFLLENFWKIEKSVHDGWRDSIARNSSGICSRRLISSNKERSIAKV